jgi:hypothetical protein
MRQKAKAKPNLCKDCPQGFAWCKKKAVMVNFSLWYLEGSRHIPAMYHRKILKNNKRSKCRRFYTIFHTNYIIFRNFEIFTFFLFFNFFSKNKNLYRKLEYCDVLLWVSSTQNSMAPFTHFKRMDFGDYLNNTDIRKVILSSPYLLDLLLSHPHPFFFHSVIISYPDEMLKLSI